MGTSRSRVQLSTFQESATCNSVFITGKYSKPHTPEDAIAMGSSHTCVPLGQTPSHRGHGLRDALSTWPIIKMLLAPLLVGQCPLPLPPSIPTKSLPSSGKKCSGCPEPQLHSNNKRKKGLGHHLYATGLPGAVQYRLHPISQERGTQSAPPGPPPHLAQTYSNDRLLTSAYETHFSAPRMNRTGLPLTSGL